jgi:octaprenyl-diphosphate synthase
MNDIKNQILSVVNDDLVDIEKELTQNLSPYFDVVSQVASHILFSGGKRLRPLLFVLSTRICDYSGNMANKFSIIFEYLHTATLLHDDIVDGATLRRGKRVANSIWGNPTAVLVGDFLLARASSIAAETGRLKVIKVLAEITENMSQGEIHQLMKKGSLDISETEYLEVIRRKTAVLFQGACSIGAMVADAPAEKETALSAYGFNLGMAFQMTDDLIDYTSDTEILGKEVGADLREGKLTLPVIHSLKHAEANDRVSMEKIIKNRDFSVEEFEMLIDLMKKYNGISHTKKLAASYIQKAKKSLSEFSFSENKNLLTMIADYILEREA